MRAASHPAPVQPRHIFALLLLGTSTFVGLALMPVMSYGISGSLYRVPVDGFSAVERGMIEVSIPARGEISSSSNRTIPSRCEWGVNLLWIEEEGTIVQRGDIIAELDSSLLQQRAKEREVLAVKAQSTLQTMESNLKVQELVNESQLAAAQLKVVLTKLEFAGYKLAQAAQERHAAEQKLAIAQSSFIDAQKKYEYTVRLAELGYTDLSDKESSRLALMKSRQSLQNEQNKLRILERYQYDRKMTELIANQEESQRALERTKLKIKTATLNGKIRVQAWRRACNAHQHALNRLKKGIDACVIRAPQAGQVIHSRVAGQSTVTVKAGDLIRYQQPLLELPDRSQLEVIVRLHESRIREIDVGQQVYIHVDAHGDLPLTGHVVRRGTVPQQGLFPNQHLRDYKVTVSVEADPEIIQQLAPGLTATVNILVAQNFEATIVPLESVVCIDGRKVCFARHGDDLEVRDLEVGMINETKVEILSGLLPGDEVVSRPREQCTALIESLRATYDEAGTGLASLWFQSPL